VFEILQLISNGYLPFIRLPIFTECEWKRTYKYDFKELSWDDYPIIVISLSPTFHNLTWDWKKPNPFDNPPWADIPF